LNINSIALEAGVSTATVSRVLNGKSDVGEETRGKILDIIQKREYRPKVSVTQTTDTVGVFISDVKSNIANPYSSMLLSGVADILFNNNLNLTLIPATKVPRIGVELVSFCRQRRISGGIYLSSNMDDVYIKELGKNMPVVTVGNDLDSEYVGSVRSDNFAGSYEAVKYLVKLGHKKILLVLADLHYIDHKERLEGAKKAIEEANLEMNRFNIMNSYVFSDVDLPHKLSFIIQNTAPDAIFVGGDQEAIRVLKALQEINVRVPQDISLIGYDNLLISANSHPPLTTVNQPIYEIGKEAAKMLLEMIKDIKYKPQKLLLKENYLIIRESVIQRD
jgi:LacI family transcriptional regulator